MGSPKNQWMLWVFATLLSVTSHADNLDPVPYYGKDFYELVENDPETRTLRNELHRVLSQWHVAGKDGFDKVVENCSSDTCFRHRALSYKNAREVLFGEIHLLQVKGQYAVEDVYCDRLRTADEFKSRPPAPGQIPNPRMVNAEHTWPQSKFNPNESRHLQKTDLHHLYPVDSRSNSARSNYPMGEVRGQDIHENCTASQKGPEVSEGYMAFEPPNQHKGNVARALFYFSVRYVRNC